MLRVHWTKRDGTEVFLDVEDDDVDAVTGPGVYAVEDIAYWQARAEAAQ